MRLAHLSTRLRTTGDVAAGPITDQYAMISDAFQLLEFGILWRILLLIVSGMYVVFLHFFFLSTTAYLLC